MTEWYLLYLITVCAPACTSVELIVPVANEQSCHALARAIRLPEKASAVAQCQLKAIKTGQPEWAA